jgi:hypothetical protein
MADLYSVIAGIEPDQQDILEAELLARQILAAQFPDLDLREGTGVRDLVIRPSAFILAICKKGLDYYFSQNTIAGVDDNTSTSLVDGLMSNLFLTRNEGTFAVINARLFFARNKAITISTTTSFSTDGTLLFFPVSAVSLPANAMSYDQYQDEYYIDVDLIAAAKGTDYNISSGSLLYFSNFDPFFLHGEINYLSQTSTAAETNTQFITRGKSAISSRNLINTPSIEYNITSNFNYVDRLISVGAGNQYMHRDQIYVRGNQGPTKFTTSAVLVNSNTQIQMGVTSHAYIVGQTINAVESGTGGLVLQSASIASIVDANNFIVNLGFSTGSRTLNQFSLYSIDPDSYVHAGGMVDVYVGDTVVSNPITLHLDVSGRAHIPGPVYSISQINGTVGDTVTYPTSFTTSFAGYASRGDITISQDSSTHIVTVVIKNHPLTIGRLVQLSNFPTNGTTTTFAVSGVPDGNTVLLGNSYQPIYSISGTNSVLTYVDPRLDTGFSESQILTIDFGGGSANGIVTVAASSFDKVANIQTYLSLAENRVLCGNLLARGYDIYVLDLTLFSYENPMPTTGAVSSILTPYLTGLTPGVDLIVSDLMAALNGSGITSLATASSISYHLYTKDLFTPISSTVTDVLRVSSGLCVFLLGNVTMSQVYL